MIGVDGNHPFAACTVKAGRQGRFLTKIARQLEHDDVFTRLNEVAQELS